MGKVSKTFALFLTLTIAIACLTLLTVKPVNAQSIPKPSIPQVTVNLTDTSYDIPPTATINPYTGETITKEGSHVESRTIEIRIRNEPFTPLEVQAGTANWTVNYLYQIRWKGHFEDQWHTMFLTDDLLGRDSGSETVFALWGTYSASEGLTIQRQGMYAAFLSTIPPKSQIDFQVKAMIGYVHRVLEGGMAPWIFTGEESEWSNIQTVTIPASSSSVTPAPSSTESLPNMGPTSPPNLNSDLITNLALVAVAILGISVISLLLFRKHRTKINSQTTSP